MAVNTFSQKLINSSTHVYQELLPGKSLDSYDALPTVFYYIRSSHQLFIKADAGNI